MENLNGFKPDILMECSGAPSVVRDALGRTAASGIICLVGVTAPGHDFDIDVGALNRTMVLDNDTVFGSVNANRPHYEMADEALSAGRQGMAQPSDHPAGADRAVDPVARAAARRH